MTFQFKALSSRNSRPSRFLSRKSIAGVLIAGGVMLFALVSRGQAQSSQPALPLQIEMSAGATTVYFEAMSGLGSESEVIEHKIIAVGAREPIIRKIPGRLKWSDIVLKRGIRRIEFDHAFRAAVFVNDADSSHRSVNSSAHN